MRLARGAAPVLLLALALLSPPTLALLDQSLPDPLQGQQYALTLIHAPEAWEHATGTGVRVAVVDSGIDPTHAELATRLDHQASTSVAEPFGAMANLPTGPWALPVDTEPHGTLVAGVLGAARGNAAGIAGVSQAELISIKAWGTGALGNAGTLAAGIQAALDRGAEIVQVSATTGTLTPELHDALQRAERQGALLVAATGNSGGTGGFYPARAGTVVGVGAVDANKQLWAQSTRQATTLVAPGVDVWTTHPGNLYSQATGTSLAAPHVAGVAALALDACPSLGASELRALLNQTAEDLAAPGFDAGTGWGLVRADLAVQHAGASCP